MNAQRTEHGAQNTARLFNFTIRFKHSGVEEVVTRWAADYAAALAGLQEFQRHCAAHKLNPVQFEIKGVDYD